MKKQLSQSFYIERFNQKKVKEVECKVQYGPEVSNRFAALEDWDAEVQINSAWEMIRENINISANVSLGYFELKKYKPWFLVWMFKIISSKETSEISVVTGSKLIK
jgi:hypothetical protein